MMKPISAMVVATVLAAALPSTLALAQTQPAQPAQQQQRPAISADVRAKLLDGRIAMIKTALALTDAQMKLWAPVEEQIRARAAERQKAMAERRQAREARAGGTALPDRIDRASEALAKRAAQAKAFSDAFKPLYTTLSDEQKVVAGLVLREARGDRGPHRGHRWAMHRTQGAPSGGATQQKQ
jgi:hypothetical protein